MSKFLYAKSGNEGFLRVDINEFRFVAIYRAVAKTEQFVWLERYATEDFLIELRQRGIKFEIEQITL